MIKLTEPDAVLHMAVASVGTGVPDEGRLVSEVWTAQLAQLCKEHRVRFLFTSTAMVFTNDAVGPFTIESQPDVTDGYGADKLAGERAALMANEDAIIARLGWQIGDYIGSNNMVDFMHRQMARDGVVKASRLWKPAMSFLHDTASALLWLLDQPGGVWMIDSNRAGHSFYDIACAVSRERHMGAYVIEPDDAFVYDQRMIDERVPIAQLPERLTTLPAIE